MPLARIVTRFPERTLAASEYFRSQGYTVEIVSPGDFRVTPATLEITLDKCTPQQALQRAKQAVEARQSGAAVPLAALPVKPEPSLDEADRAPTAFDIAGRPVEFEAPVERRQSGQGFLAALRSVLQRGWIGARAALTSKIGTKRGGGQVQSLRIAPVLPQHSVQEDEAGHARAEREAEQRERVAVEERTRLERAQRERERAARERAAREERERIEREQRERAAAEERARLEREEQKRLAREQAAREQQERQRAARERLAAEERERIEREKRERAAAAEQALLAAEKARLEAEQQERERVAAAHEALIAAQRERERAQAQQQTAEIPVVPPPQPVPRPVAAPLSTLQRAIPAGVRAGSEMYRRAGWKSRLIAGSAAVLLIIAGIVAYANRRPASPLSNSDLVKSETLQQKTPFGAATVTPPVPISKPTPAVAPKPAPPRTQHRSATKRPPAKTRRAARRLRRSTSQDDSVAEDEVVVRHFTKTPPATTSTATAGMKKYSDMN